MEAHEHFDPTTLWTAIGVVASVVLAFFGWIITVERRMGKAMTRDEHAEICEQRNKAVLEKLTEISNDIKEGETRDALMLEKVNDLRADVAVLKRVDQDNYQR